MAQQHAWIRGGIKASRRGRAARGSALERRAGDDVQKLTDRFVAEIDKLVTTKEAEIMTV